MAYKVGNISVINSREHIRLTDLGVPFRGVSCHKKASYIPEFVVCFSSGVIWEEKKKKRFKALKLKHSQVIEQAWSSWSTETSLGKDLPSRININTKMNVSLGGLAR